MNNELIKWSRTLYSDLPWRKKRTLYTTLVSEIMLQQTTVGAVKNSFDRFIGLFPSLEDLANASEEEVLKAWKGLGYYRRARNLLAAAQDIQFNNRGRFPQGLEELTKLKGIGDYTASAIEAIGRDHWALALDANIERVLARYYGLALEKGPKLKKALHLLYSEDKQFKNLKKVSPRHWSEAMMDLGREVCTQAAPNCSICPLQKKCLGNKLGDPLKFPLKNSKMEEKIELHLVRFLVFNGDLVLAYKKKKGEWLEGQYEVPTFLSKGSLSSSHRFTQYPSIEKTSLATKLFIFKTAITKYKILNDCYHLTLDMAKTILKNRNSYEWVNPEEVHLSTASEKALKRFNKIN